MRQKDCEFKAYLSHIGRESLPKKNKKKKIPVTSSVQPSSSKSLLYQKLRKMVKSKPFWSLLIITYFWKYSKEI
jgi:hypothetical protein